MRYIIASTAVTDEICLADGKKVGKVAGGAGIYALCGIKVWCDDVLLVTGVGQDYRSIYGQWYEDNDISMEGLMIKGNRTPHTVVQYLDNGEREETPLYGLEHYQKMESAPEDLEPYFQTASGIYIFKNSNTCFWEKIIQMKKNSKVVIMWEIANDATYVDNKEHVKDIARNFEILSINLTEAKNLLEKEGLEEIIEEFQTWGMELIFLRMGSKGAVMITPSQKMKVPSMEGVHVVDPTGGGNSSSGAVLYGFCKGYDLRSCGQMGNISAAMCISGYGIPAIVKTEKYRTMFEERGGKC